MYYIKNNDELFAVLYKLATLGLGHAYHAVFSYAFVSSEILGSDTGTQSKQVKLLTWSTWIFMASFLYAALSLKWMSGEITALSTVSIYTILEDLSRRVFYFKRVCRVHSSFLVASRLEEQHNDDVIENTRFYSEFWFAYQAQICLKSYIFWQTSVLAEWYKNFKWEMPCRSHSEAF